MLVVKGQISQGHVGLGNSLRRGFHHRPGIRQVNTQMHRVVFGGHNGNGAAVLELGVFKFGNLGIGRKPFLKLAGRQITVDLVVADTGGHSIADKVLLAYLVKTREQL